MEGTARNDRWVSSTSIASGASIEQRQTARFV
jgi:hypothetical protein